MPIADEIQATVSEQSPPLPADGEKRCCMMGSKPAVVFRGGPGYVVHTPAHRRTYTRREIDRWWHSVSTWVPSRPEERHLEQARKGIRSYQDALSDIRRLYFTPQ